MWRQALTALALALRLSAVLITTILGLLFLGIFVDRSVGTTPFGVLCFMVIAITFGTVAVYSIVSKSFPQPPTGSGNRSGEDAVKKR